MIDKNYRSLTNTILMMNIQEKKADTSVKIEKGKTDGVSQDDHHKTMEKKTFRIDNAEVEHENAETLDEAQFILLKKGAMTKRIRNDPDEITRAKAQGWVISGSTNEETIPLDEMEMGSSWKKHKIGATVSSNPKSEKYAKTIHVKAADNDSAQAMAKSKLKKTGLHVHSTTHNGYVTEEQVDEISDTKVKDYLHKNIDSVKNDANANKRTKGFNAGVNRLLANVKSSKSNPGHNRLVTAISGKNDVAQRAVNSDDAVLIKGGLKNTIDALAKTKIKNKGKAFEETEMTQQVDELSKPTLKSYMKKSQSSHYKASVKADSEEDKAMSTDGEKYPDKQKRHNNNAEKEIRKMIKRDKGINMATKKLTKEDIENLPIDEARAILEDAMAKRGRPTKDSAGDREHIVVGLRKAISLQGQHPVHFTDGSSHKVSATDAANALQRHDSHAKPSEKMAFAQKISASHTAFSSAMKEKIKTEPAKKEPDKKPVSVAKKATIHLNVN